MRHAVAAALALALVAPLATPPAARAADAACMTEPPSTLPVPPARTETINGRPVIRYLPPHPKGIVYLFHGTGGSEAFAVRIHSQRVLAALIADGYGYASAPSLDRTAKRWDIRSLDPKANADVAWMLSLHQALIDKGEITATTPVFTTGMSNGGAFANLFGTAAKLQGLPVVAVADYMGPFPEPMRAALPDLRKLPPTLVILGQNDGMVSAERTAAVTEMLVKQGAVVETHVNPERRVCAATFALVPGLSAADRETLVSKTLVASGLIDAQGRRTLFNADPVITRPDMEVLEKTVPAGANGRDINNELLIAWAAHQMRSDFADRQVEFFDGALAAAARK